MAPISGRSVLKATLFLHRAGDDQLRYIRVSTVNGDWERGQCNRPLQPRRRSDLFAGRCAVASPWSWTGSCFADVVMTSGHSLAALGRAKGSAGRMGLRAVTPLLVYAMVAGDTDGLAVMDGGTLSLHNNMIHSVQSAGLRRTSRWRRGRPPTEAPAAPVALAAPRRNRPTWHGGHTGRDRSPPKNTVLAADTGRAARPAMAGEAPGAVGTDRLLAGRTSSFTRLSCESWQLPLRGRRQRRQWSVSILARADAAPPACRSFAHRRRLPRPRFTTAPCAVGACRVGQGQPGNSPRR